MSDFELPMSSLPKKNSNAAPSDPVKVKSEQTLEGKEGPPKPSEPTYTKEELFKVFDEIIFSQEYTEDFIIRGKLSVTFRTRTAEEINVIQKAIDGSGFTLISSVENLRSLMNLQYALVNYNGKDLSTLKIEEKAKFLEKLPGPIVGVMLTLLGKFDHKVSLACQEGELNF